METFRLGDVTVDPAGHELCVRGEPIVVRDKVMRALLHLVANSDRVVTKDELLTALWPRHAASEESLTQVVSELRRALGDDAKQAKIIRTIPKRGYRLVAVVGPATNEPASVPAVDVVSASPMAAPMRRLSGFIARHPQIVMLAFALVIMQTALRILIHHH